MKGSSCGSCSHPVARARRVRSRAAPGSPGYRMITRQHSPSTRLPAMQGCFLCFGKTRGGPDLLWHVLARPEAAPHLHRLPSQHGGRRRRGPGPIFALSTFPTARAEARGGRDGHGGPYQHGVISPKSQMQGKPVTSTGSRTGHGDPLRPPRSPDSSMGLWEPPPTPLPQRRRRKHNKQNKIYKPGGNYSVATKGCLLRAIIMWLNLTPRVPGL